MSNIQVLREHSRPVPQWTTDLISQLGRNPYGEALFRIVWSGEVHEMIGGLFLDTATREWRRVPRYPGVQRFLLEKWQPPEAYGTPESWNRASDGYGFNPCGDYPFQGGYEHLYTFESSGQFVSLDPTLLRMLVASVLTRKLKSVWERFVESRDQKEREEQEQGRIFEDVYDDAKNVYFSATVGYGGQSMNKLDRAKIGDARKLNPKVRTPHAGLTQL